eukprot:EG_transcript_3014
MLSFSIFVLLLLLDGNRAQSSGGGDWLSPAPRSPVPLPSSPPAPSNLSQPWNLSALDPGCLYIFFDVEGDSALPSPPYASPNPGGANPSPDPWPPALHSPRGPGQTLTATLTASETLTPTPTGRHIVVDGDDCVVGNWVNSSCSAKCGGGLMTMRRSVLQPPTGNGAGCPALTLTVPCNTNPCSDPPDDGCICVGGNGTVKVNGTNHSAGDDPSGPPPFIVVPTKNSSDPNTACAAYWNSTNKTNATATPYGYSFPINTSAAGSYVLCIGQSNGTVYPVPVVVGGVQSVTVNGQSCPADGTPITVDGTTQQVQLIGVNLPANMQYTLVPTGATCPGSGAVLTAYHSAISRSSDAARTSVIAVPITAGLKGPLTVCYYMDNRWNAFPTCVVVSNRAVSNTTAPAAAGGGGSSDTIWIAIAAILGVAGALAGGLLAWAFLHSTPIVAAAVVETAAAAPITGGAVTGEVLVTFGDVAGSAAAAPPPTPLVPELEPPVAAELPPAAPPVEPRSVPPVQPNLDIPIIEVTPAAPLAVAPTLVNPLSPLAAPRALQRPLPVLPPPLTNPNVALVSVPFPVGPNPTPAKKKPPALATSLPASEFPVVLTPVAAMVQPVYPEILLGPSSPAAVVQPAYPEVQLGPAPDAATVQPAYPEVSVEAASPPAAVAATVHSMFPEIVFRVPPALSDTA